MSTVGVSWCSMQIIFYPHQLMWLIFAPFDASTVFQVLFDLQHLVLACCTKMEANINS